MSGARLSPRPGRAIDTGGIQHEENGRSMMAQLPAWLSYTFGLVMLAVAAYNFDLLAFSISGRYLPGSDAEISEIFCGISMAGMFVSDWAFGPS